MGIHDGSSIRGRFGAFRRTGCLAAPSGWLRTGHQGLVRTVTGAMAAGSVLASLAILCYQCFSVGFRHQGCLGAIGVCVLGLLITAAAFWLAVKPWPAPRSFQERHR